MTSLAPTALTASVFIMTSFSLWRHSLLNWSCPSLWTYGRTYVPTDTSPHLIYKDMCRLDVFRSVQVTRGARGSWRLEGARIHQGLQSTWTARGKLLQDSVSCVPWEVPERMLAACQWATEQAGQSFVPFTSVLQSCWFLTQLPSASSSCLLLSGETWFYLR